MKKIVLSLGVLLMLAQNGFAISDKEWDKMIANTSIKVNKLIFSCNKEYEHRYSGDPKVCIKAFNVLRKEYPNERDNTTAMALNAGILYYDSKKDYLKAYEYWMKSAKLEDTQAQGNLDILCKEHSWVCK